jgi:hypothetical protein
MVVGLPQAVRRDLEIVPIRIYQPEVLQSPRLRSNVHIQHGASLADNEVSLFLQIINFDYNLDTFVRSPIAFFFFSVPEDGVPMAPVKTLSRFR